MEQNIRQRIADIRRGNVPVGYKRTKLGIIPSDWNLRIMGELTSQLTEQNGSSTDFPAYSINNQIGFIPQNLQFEEGSYDYLDKTSYRVVSRGQFAYNPARINVGSIGVLKDREKVIVSSLYVCFSVRQEVDSSFLEYWFHTLDFYKEIIRNTEGSVREYLFYENFANIKIALPSLAEQKRIAEILGGCDRGIALKKELIAEKKRQKKALMQKLLNPDSGFRLPGFSGEWRKTTIGEIGTFAKGKGIQNSQCQKSGLPCVKYGDIYMKYNVCFDAAKSFTTSDVFNSSLQVTSGVLLFTCSGEDSREIGKCTLYTGERPIVVGGDIIVMYPHESLSPAFLAYQQYSDDLIRQKNAFGKGNSIVHIHLPEISSLKIALPPTRQEQQAIADILSAADREIDLLEQELAQQQQKKKSLMELLLTGIARV